jgi:hypothetical protein
VIDICKRYDAAPVDALQLKVGLIETAVAPFDGEAKVGAAGAATMVVKLHVPE